MREAWFTPPLPPSRGEFNARPARNTDSPLEGGKGGVTIPSILQELSTKLLGVENLYNVDFDPNINLMHYFINSYGDISSKKRLV